jgi:hypothetical protein
MTVGAHHRAHEIDLREIDDVQIYKQVPPSSVPHKQIKHAI